MRRSEESLADTRLEQPLLSSGRLLTKVKEPIPQEDRNGVAYKIRCMCGDFYIGETGRSANTRMKEHKAACRWARFERSAVAEHAWKDGHIIIIEWDEVKILDTARDERERRVKEALYIRLAPPGLKMNRNEGKDISPLWLSAMKTTQGPHCRQGSNATQPLTVSESHHPPPNRRTRLESHLPPTPPPSVRRPTPRLRQRRTSHATPVNSSQDATDRVIPPTGR